MMLLGPLVIALIPVILVLMLTKWFSKKELPFLIIVLPGVMSFVIAVSLFYGGFVHVRGFLGLSYGILSMYLMIAGMLSLLIGKNVKYSRYI